MAASALRGEALRLISEQHTYKQNYYILLYLVNFFEHKQYCDCSEGDTIYDRYMDLHCGECEALR